MPAALCSTTALAALLTRCWDGRRAVLTGTLILAAGVPHHLHRNPREPRSAPVRRQCRGRPRLRAGVCRTFHTQIEADARAELLTAVYVVSYVAFAVPAVSAGLAAGEPKPILEVPPLPSTRAPRRHPAHHRQSDRRPIGPVQSEAIVNQTDHHTAPTARAAARSPVDLQGVSSADLFRERRQAKMRSLESRRGSAASNVSANIVRRAPSTAANLAKSGPTGWPMYQTSHAPRAIGSQTCESARTTRAPTTITTAAARAASDHRSRSCASAVGAIGDGLPGA